MVGTKIAHYRLTAMLGAGGMGEVYLAEGTRLDRRVALKLLPPALVSDEQAKKRLLRGAKSAATLDPPNICAIYEVGEENGRSFIAMQFVEGETTVTSTPKTACCPPHRKRRPSECRAPTGLRGVDPHAALRIDPRYGSVLT